MENCVTINKQKIAWPFIMGVRKMLGGDWDSTIDLFYKARNCTGENAIIKYVMAGFKRIDGKTPYAYLPSKERNEGKMKEIHAWWRNEVYVAKKQPMSFAQIMQKAMSMGVSGQQDAQQTSLLF